MAKGNKKALQDEARKNVGIQFKELKNIFTDLKLGMQKSNMPLLAKNIDLSIDLLDAYEIAFLGK